MAKSLRFLQSSLEFWLHIQFRIALILSTTFFYKPIKSIVDIVEHGHFVGLQKKKANNSDSIRLLFGFSHRKAIFDVNEVQLFKFLLINHNSNGSQFTIQLRIRCNEIFLWNWNSEWSKISELLIRKFLLQIERLLCHLLIYICQHLILAKLEIGKKLIIFFLLGKKKHIANRKIKVWALF